jgi:acyl-CoA synthetase (AMP-forming)/AMP-acid ligase II
MLLTELFTSNGNPTAPALIFEGSTFSYSQLDCLVSDVAERLATASVGPGTKVLVALPNSPASLISMLAVNACGAVFMPLNPGLTAEERQRIDELARPDFVIGNDGQAALGPGAWLTPSRSSPYDDDDLAGVAALIFTSGTTGVPKGVMMTEQALIANARSVAGYLGLSKMDRTLVFLPIYYTYTLSQMFSTWLAGGCVVLMPHLRYPLQVLSAIGAQKVTGFGGVPTSLNVLASHSAVSTVKQRSLRYILSAGGPLAPVVVHRVQQAFPQAALFNNYGCTEIGPRATAVNFTAHPDKVGSIGRAIPGVNVSIIRPDRSVADVGETGEIVLHGPSLMTGYYRDPETTRARLSAYGFHTGDFAWRDADGFLYFEGRTDDIFKSAGEKVSAREIEDVAMDHEAVAEAAIISEPDPISGAVPILYVVLRRGAVCTERDLRAFCACRLSTHKVPKAVHFVRELHKTATGKIQKHRLNAACL